MGKSTASYKKKSIFTTTERQPDLLKTPDARKSWKIPSYLVPVPRLLPPAPWIPQSCTPALYIAFELLGWFFNPLTPQKNESFKNNCKHSHTRTHSRGKRIFKTQKKLSAFAVPIHYFFFSPSPVPPLGCSFQGGRLRRSSSTPRNPPQWTSSPWQKEREKKRTKFHCATANKKKKKISTRDSVAGKVDTNYNFGKYTCQGRRRSLPSPWQDRWPHQSIDYCSGRQNRATVDLLYLTKRAYS